MIPLDEVLKIATQDWRICPQPQQWKKLWELLPNRRRKESGWEPSLPLILAAWWETTNEQKQQRFHDHVRWADEHDALQVIADFIDQMGDNDWYNGD